MRHQCGSGGCVSQEVGLSLCTDSESSCGGWPESAHRLRKLMVRDALAMGIGCTGRCEKGTRNFDLYDHQIVIALMTCMGL